jgi:hypothetical protein
MADPLIEFGVESASGPLRVKSGNAMIKQKISARVIRDLVQPVASPGIVRCAAGSGSSGVGYVETGFTLTLQSEYHAA